MLVGSSWRSENVGAIVEVIGTLQGVNGSDGTETGLTAEMTKLSERFGDPREDHNAQAA